VPEVLHGLEGLRRVVAHWTAPYDEFGAEVFEYVDAHPWVICDTRWHVKGEGSDASIDVHFADAYEIKDGRIVRAIMGCPNVATALEVVRLQESV
jgi:SnoaL-like domain